MYNQYAKEVGVVLSLKRLQTLFLSASALVAVLFAGSAWQIDKVSSPPAHASALVANSASSCGTIEILLDMEDPFAIAYNPVSNYVYVLRSGTTESQVAVLRYGREVARIDFPPSGFSELTSIGTNPSSGLTYVTQWSSDRVHFIDSTRVISSYSTGYWGPAGVWSSTSNSATYVSGKWVQSTSKVVYFGGTTPIRVVDVGFNANPNAGVVATNSQYLYLANSYSNTVSVLNNGSLLATIKVGDHPNGIAYNPTSGYIYAVNRGTAATQSTVSVISGTAVLATIPLGPGYDDYLGVHPKDAITINRNVYRGGTDIVTTDPRTGYVYVSNWGANTVSVISGTVLLVTVPVGVHPNGIAYNPVTGLVYVANTGDDTVTLIEGTHIVSTVLVGDYPIDLAVDTRSGLVYAVNRGSNSLSIIRCEDNLHEKRVLGHYMTWYKTKKSYGEGCFNPDARDEWRMWNMCGHNPDTITGTHGFRDIAAVHYPLIGPYDSADPKVIEYHLLQALAAEIDTFVIDFYGENDAGGVDEAALRVLQQVEEMNARYDTNFKIALMYDEGALQNQSGPVIEATSDFAYMLCTYASSPAYLWANGKPVMFYFPKGPVLSPTELAAVAGDFSLVYPDFPPDYLSVMDGSYAWVKAEPWEEDCSNWGEPYLRWYYPTLDFMATTVPTLTFGVGAVWAGFDDVGVGREWWCVDHRCIDRQGGQVYDRTWDILDGYNDSVGITYTVPISWVQLVTLNDYMEGTELFPTVEHGHQYVQRTEDHAREFKGLPDDDRLDIYVAQHIYNARLLYWLPRVFLPVVLRDYSHVVQPTHNVQVTGGTWSNQALIDDALNAFHSGRYATAMTLADAAAGIPAPKNVTAVPTGRALTVCWQDRPWAWLASGHRVYYGLAPGEYISSTRVLTDSCVTLSDVAGSTTYYIAVTTLGATNPCETWYVSESWYSDEIVVKTPASLTHNHGR